jgi:8-amino-7-oxononanoate synthase
MNGRDVLMFGSCDYLGLSQHPLLAEKAIEAIRTFGTTTKGSQGLCGYTTLHQGIEQHLARIHAKESAVLLPSGMTANIAVLTTVGGPEDVIINDRANHVSIFMGSQLSGAKVRTFPHNDLDRLEYLLARNADRRRRIVVVDGLFSADGDFAPLDRVVELTKRHDALLIVDEAHSFGAAGPNGLGVADHFGIVDQVDVLVGSLGKALGSVGGFVVTTKQIDLQLRAQSPAYGASRGAAPAVAGATLAALQLLEREGKALRERLAANVRYITDRLVAEGFDLLDTTSHVLPVMIGAEDQTVAVARWLRDNGVFTAAFIEPYVPKGMGRLRLGVMATHTHAECEQLCDALVQARKAFAFR